MLNNNKNDNDTHPNEQKNSISSQLLNTSPKLSPISNSNSSMPHNEHFELRNSKSNSRVKLNDVQMQIKQYIDNASINDVKTLIDEKTCSGKSSFVFSNLSKIFGGLTIIFSGLQLHVPYKSIGIVTLICSTLSMTFIGFSNYYSKQSAYKNTKLSDIAKQLHLNSIIIDLSDPVIADKDI